METENVLIWPEEYVLLLKGLLEQNGAFILDALEAWPKCEESIDQQGVCSISLPPIYYLLWQKPAEPFDSTDCQHLSDFDDLAYKYIESVLKDLKLQLGNDEQITLLLLERLSGYSDLESQMVIKSKLSLACLAQQKRFLNVLKLLLEQGLQLSTSDVMSLLSYDELHPLLMPFLNKSVMDKQALISLFTEQLLQGEDRFEFLAQLEPDDSKGILLESALLEQLKQSSAKQSICKRFMEQGAKGLLADENGKTCLMWAVERGFLDVLEILCNEELLTQKDNQGNTVLHYAVICKNEFAIKFLLKKNIDFTIRNNLEFTAYGLAVELEHKQIVQFLESQFGIKELSKPKQFKRINLVHSIHAFIGVLLPVQLFFFFEPDFDLKSELSFILALVSMLLMFFAMNLKRCSLYPDIKHPWSLSLLRAISPFSLISQLMLLLVVIIVALT
ncbi:ankyrin repeat domain-containing protein [Pseudoalteromonas denitrificans]|uniref:Ankyrin repeat n=1 Tax=Pseudoalteromonas denitrificans DSM 6059 TaxID=1123010 RepID=A0A1I1L679_9GAMM|nr:ankyrin repeat domain-containing protein [Pseudoalteromonas denitrificans]SFC65080.1 Ankyrin repeat [Pseudoalteromonas denitrificans DSM 6059]